MPPYSIDNAQMEDLAMNLPGSRITLMALLSVCILFALTHLSQSSHSTPIDPEKLPLAFWSWRSEMPSNADVRAAVSATGTKLLFQRAGQVDVEGDVLKRIRSPKGRFPEGIEIHLVYNATRALLRRLGSLPPEQPACAIAAAYSEDAVRARADGATVTGVQIDFDYPTRLLPEYAVMLRSLKERLPADLHVSITGLPTWAGSSRLSEVLDQVDFWVPQLYGAAIPEHISDPRPISSPVEVSRAVTKVSELQKPFYAGLSAYGYALLFDRQGGLVEVRGDLDRSSVQRDPAFALDATQTFQSSTGEGRSVYKATRPTVVEGSAVEEGEFLVFDEPTADLLRANATAARRAAGKHLLGICVFRLPSDTDATNLRIEDVADAIFDREGIFRSEIRAAQKQGGTVEVALLNSGTGGVRFGEGEMTLDILAGSVRSVEPVDGFADVRTLCGSGYRLLTPCGSRRADLTRLVAEAWRPRDQASVRIKAVGEFMVRLTVMKNGKVVESVERSFLSEGEK